jgi:hypothetical protein
LLLFWKRRILLFPEKEAKSVVLLRRRFVGTPKLGEADPGGSGGLPPRIERIYERKEIVGIGRDEGLPGMVFVL